MVRRIQQPLNNFSGIGAGQVATIDVPVGPTYDIITLEYKDNGALANEATMVSKIEEVRIFINGVLQRRHSARDIIDLNSRHGYAFRDGYLPLFFIEPWREERIGQDELSWGTENLGSFTIEVTLASNAVSPQLKAQSLTRQIRRPIGQIKKFIKKTVPITATGENTYQADILDPLEAIHCRSTDIEKIRLKTDSVTVFDLDAEQIKNFLALGNKKELVAGLLSVDFSLFGRIDDFLPMFLAGTDGKSYRVQDFPITFTMGAATSFEIIEERIGLAV